MIKGVKMNKLYPVFEAAIMRIFQKVHFTGGFINEKLSTSKLAQEYCLLMKY